MHGTAGRAGEDGGIPPPGDRDSLASSPRGRGAPADGWRGRQELDLEGAGVEPPGRPRGRNGGIWRGEEKGPVLSRGRGVPGSSVDLWWEKGSGVRGERKREKGGGQANTHVHRLIPNENRNQPKPNS